MVVYERPGIEDRNVVWDEAVARAFGEQVRSLRRSAGLSQEELAHRVGITKNQIQLIEAGRQSGRDTGRPSNPRASTLFGLAYSLGVATWELLQDVEAAVSGDDLGGPTSGSV